MRALVTSSPDTAPSPTSASTASSRALIAAGIPMIRKRMYKDGHMVAEEQHYLRSPRIKRGQPYLMIWNGNYAIEGADTMWNRDGRVLLQVERGIGGDS